MCTSVILKSKDGAVIHGRTNEFGSYYKNDLILFPRNYQYKKAIFGTAQLKSTTKYAHLSCNAGMILGDKFNIDELLVDGINEKGLSFSVHYYPVSAKYKLVQELADNQIDFLSFFWEIAGNCANCSDVLNYVTKYNGNFVMLAEFAAPGHVLIVDSTGDSYAIEPDEPGYLTITKTNGVFTNSPQYKFHLQNLNNYANIQQYDTVEKDNVLGDSISSFGISGGFGVPFDTSPTSRFVRATYLLNATTKKTILTADDGILRMQRLLNNFDILPGQALKKIVPGIVGEVPSTHTDNAVESDHSNSVSAHTDHIIIKDSSRLRFYYKDWCNQSWRYADINDYDLDSSKIVKIKMISDGAKLAHKITLR